jgi:hypothetical protein
MSQQRPRYQVGRQIDRDASRAQQDQPGKRAGDFKAVAGLLDARGETRLGAAGAEDKFGDNRADQREPAADPQPSEEIGKRGRQF